MEHLKGSLLPWFRFRSCRQYQQIGGVITCQYWIMNKTQPNGFYTNKERLRWNCNLNIFETIKLPITETQNFPEMPCWTSPNIIIEGGARNHFHVYTPQSRHQNGDHRRHHRDFRRGHYQRLGGPQPTPSVDPNWSAAVGLWIPPKFPYHSSGQVC